MPKMIESPFRLEIEKLLNQHSAENVSNTPDHILADYLIASLAAFDDAVNARERWYGRSPVFAVEKPEEMMKPG